MSASVAISDALKPKPSPPSENQLGDLGHQDVKVIESVGPTQSEWTEKWQKPMVVVSWGGCLGQTAACVTPASTPKWRSGTHSGQPPVLPFQPVTLWWLLRCFQGDWASEPVKAEDSAL